MNIESLQIPLEKSPVFSVIEPFIFKQKALQWAAGFSTCCYLDSNNNDVYGKPDYDLLIAAGAKENLECAAGNAFEQLKTFHKKNPGWIFGFFSYDLKNEVEDLHSNHPDHINFPNLFFFQPQIRLEMKGREVYIFPEKLAAEVFANIEAIDIAQVDGALSLGHSEPVEPRAPALRQAQGDPQLVDYKASVTLSKVEVRATATVPQAQVPSTSLRMTNAPKILQARFTKKDYLAIVNKLKEHIAWGDVYEVNLCQEFYDDDAEINPVAIFQSLNKISNAPFSAFLKHDGRYLLSSSPERFLKKTSNKLVSQPIKGTIRRGENASEDERLRTQLQNDPKERAENVMIVDLVRNDLSRVCEPDSVKVDELFGVYTFQQVHHMVSSVSGELKEGIHFTDAIKNIFPMGSMTGAPKVKAMELIEQYECTRRGLYSGALGYITPDGDFDLNVVIRSILYNEAAHYLSYQVGGAITYNSVPEKEYEECLLKAEGMREVLGG